MSIQELENHLERLKATNLDLGCVPAIKKGILFYPLGAGKQ